MPGLGAYLGASREGRSFPPGHPHYQPPQAATSLEEQQASRREEWEARDLDAEAELDRPWAQATYLWTLSDLGLRRHPSGGNHAGGVGLEYSHLVVAWALS